MRTILPVAISLAVAVAFGVSLAAVSEHSWWRFWGWVWAAFVTPLTFGLTLWTFNRARARGSRLARRIVMGTLTLLGLATTYWIALMGGGSPFSLEAMWIYPLAIVPLAIVAFMFAFRRRSKREGFLWERPPGPSH